MEKEDNDFGIRKCHICGTKTEKWDRCDKCNKITCFSHLVHNPLFTNDICKKCQDEFDKQLKEAKERGEYFT